LCGCWCGGDFFTKQFFEGELHVVLHDKKTHLKLVERAIFFM
jgi:hypothetical protein